MFAYALAWPQEYAHYKHEQEMKLKGGHCFIIDSSLIHPDECGSATPCKKERPRDWRWTRGTPCLVRTNQVYLFTLCASNLLALDDPPVRFRGFRGLAPERNSVR